MIISLLHALLMPGLSLIAGDSIPAIKCAEPPLIDGLVREPLWEDAPPVTLFYQREPYPGQASGLQTEFRFAYNEDYLFIAIRCIGDADDIVAKEMARDVDLSNDDRVQIILDTYMDRRNAYWFQIGPRGSIGDAIISENGAAFNKAWDGLWTGKAQITEQGWEAELALPFKTFSFDAGNEAWGLKLIRYQKSSEEVAYWPVANINTHRFQVSDAGVLYGLKGISQGIGLDLVPYGLGGFDLKEGDPGLHPVYNAGLEAYYNLTSSMKAALTLNTDFAQTEVDQQEINLTRFSLFYPEKRDFFLDGANYFNFGINGDRANDWNTRLIPFFSRRVGLDLDGNPIPVLYGGKIIGQAGKWNVGAMYMKDKRPDWQNGNFAVTRITRNIGSQSQAGLISTYGNALQDSANYLLGFDLRLATSTFRKDKNLSFTLYGLKSFSPVPGENASSARRDLAYGAELVYPNDILSLRLGHMQIQENFEAGLGFVPRPGVRQSYLDLTLGYRPEIWGILQVLGGGGIDHISDFHASMLSRENYLMPLRVRLLSGDEFSYRMYSSFELLEEPFNLYNIYTIPAGQYNFGWHTFSATSAKKRDVWLSADYRFGGFYSGTRKELSLKAGYQVFIPLFLGGELVRNDIDLGEQGSFVANIYRLNLNILFNPSITLYSFIQYDSESDNMGWQSRFQWIIQPGREIFLVWNSISRDPFERFAMEEAGARLKVKYTLRF